MRIIFHIDVNSAFLSWEAVKRLDQGENLDLREIPSAVAGSPETRKGIILAKSIPAKAFGIRTGEPLITALRKCPQLTLVKPDRDLYEQCSKALMEFLQRYSSLIEPFSVDECFLDMSHTEKPIQKAHEIKDAIKNELGFTVNIGVGPNKLLAKMASDFKKPDRVHSLFHRDLEKKLWPLPIHEMYMVGEKTAERLRRIGILTIGDLAGSDPEILRMHFHSYGESLRQMARGIDNSPIHLPGEIDEKSIGNSTTLPWDMSEEAELLGYLLKLCEKSARRLRRRKKMTEEVSVILKDAGFQQRSRQMQLSMPENTTAQIYRYAHRLFGELWEGEPIRLIGVRLGALIDESERQLTLFEDEEDRLRKLDETLDQLQERFGDASLMRASLMKKPKK